jgi:hypothetical protein
MTGTGLLPEDLWVRVADHLSLLEWARAAGACKMFWRLRLNMIRSSSLWIPEPEGLRVEWRLRHLTPQERQRGTAAL